MKFIDHNPQACASWAVKGATVCMANEPFLVHVAAFTLYRCAPGTAPLITLTMFAAVQPGGARNCVGQRKMSLESACPNST